MEPAEAVITYIAQDCLYTTKKNGLTYVRPIHFDFGRLLRCRLRQLRLRLFLDDQLVALDYDLAEPRQALQS